MGIFSVHYHLEESFFGNNLSLALDKFKTQIPKTIQSR